jgi:hypothetical protein
MENRFKGMYMAGIPLDNHKDVPLQPVIKQGDPINENRVFDIDRDDGSSTCGTYFSGDNYHLNYIVMMPNNVNSLEPLNQLFNNGKQDDRAKKITENVNITINSKFKFLNIDNSRDNYILCFSPNDHQDEYKSATVPKNLLKLVPLGSFKELEELKKLNEVKLEEIKEVELAAKKSSIEVELVAEKASIDIETKYSEKLSMLEETIDLVKEGYEKIKTEIKNETYPLTPPDSPTLQPSCVTTNPTNILHYIRAELKTDPKRIGKLYFRTNPMDDIHLAQMFYLCDKEGNWHDFEPRTLTIRKIKRIPTNIKDNYNTIKKFTKSSDVSWVG